VELYSSAALHCSLLCSRYVPLYIQVDRLDPATHAYAFWDGIPESGKRAFGALFLKSRTMKAVAVVQRAIRGLTPVETMRQLGFGPLQYVANFVVTMSGASSVRRVNVRLAMHIIHIQLCIPHYLITQAANGGSRHTFSRSQEVRNILKFNKWTAPPCD
jgi:hypothetical protein